MKELTIISLYKKTIKLNQKKNSIILFPLFLIFWTGYSQVAPGGVTTQLTIWLKANDGIAVADGVIVNNWVDKSGVRVNNATNGGELSSPVYRTTGTKRINFNPTVEFDGINNGLNFGNDYVFTLAAQGGLNLFVVAKPDITSAAKTAPFVFDFGFYGDRGYGFAIGSHRSYGYTSIGNGGSEFFTTWAGTSEPNVYNYDVNFGTNKNIIINNLVRATSTISLVELDASRIDENSSHQVTSGPITIGRQSKSGNLTFSNNRAFDGLLGEIIHYSNNLSATETLKINSYLAIKYGITLDQTSPNNYLATDGTVIWDATTAGAYNKNIFGIGRDDLTALHQQISKSVNADGIITLSTDTDFTANNASHATITNDLNYLLVADNGLNTQFDTYISGFALYHMNRIWKVQKTGSAIASVNIKLDNTDADYLLLSTDAVFDSSDTKIPITTDAFLNIPLENNMYFTFGNSICYENGSTGTPVSGQNMIISTFDASASQSWIRSVDNGMLILGSKTKGFVITRMESPETTIISPVEGMLVFDTDDQVMKLYNGTSWVVLEQRCH